MMRKNKFKKVIASLLLTATVATVGFSAIACSEEHTHKWTRDWDDECHWYVCKEDGKKKDVQPHTGIEDGICDECGATVSGIDNPTGGVYTITLNANGGTLGSVTTVKTSNGKLTGIPAAPAAPANKKFKGWYDAANGGQPISMDTVFTADTTIYAQWNDVAPTVGKNEYTVYLYAPELKQAPVRVSVWGKMAGAFEDDMPMTADPDGWYSFTFKTDKEIADGANFNYYTDEDDEWDITGYTTDANWVYFISNKPEQVGDDYNIYNSKTAAVQAYNDIAGVKPEPGQTETVKVHFHKLAGWTGGAAIHAYYNDGKDIPVTLGAYGTVLMTAGADDWYTYELAFPKGTTKYWVHVIDSTDTNVNLMINEITIGIGGDLYINNKGHIFDSENAAKADENAAAVNIRVNVHKDSAWKNNDVVVYIWGTKQVLGGDFEANKMIPDGNGWYHFDIDMAGCQFTTEEGVSYNLIVSEANDGTQKNRFEVSLVYTGSEYTLWFARDGKSCDDKAAVEEYEGELDKSGTFDVVIHFQVPEVNGKYWTIEGKLGIHAWNDAGFGPTTFWQDSMESEAGHSGWYTYTISGVSNLKKDEAINVIFYDMNNQEDNDKVFDQGRVTLYGAVQLKGEIWVTKDGKVSYTAPASYTA